MSANYKKAAPKVRTSMCECGKPIYSTTNPKKYCDTCVADRKRESARKAMTKQRLKKGIAPVKGTTIICERCEREFVRKGIAAKFCDECQYPAMLERAKARVNRLSRERGARQIGTEQICTHCEKPYIYLKSRQTLCEACQILSKQGKLPYLIEARIRWTEKRKAELEEYRLLNPPQPPNSQPRNCNCTICTEPYVTTARFSKYCDTCSPKAYRHISKLKQRRVARARGVTQIGSLRECRRCENEFPIRGMLHIYCDTCAPIVEKECLVAYKPKRNIIVKAYIKKRLKTDKTFAINMRMSSAIRGCLAGTKKNRRWETLVGYTITDLVKHIEKCFGKTGMTWENRSKWHIDHIHPLSSFKFETPDDPEFKAAWAITNLRPLWAKENLLKSNKIQSLL